MWREKSVCVTDKECALKNFYHGYTDREHLLLATLFAKNHQRQLTTKNDSSKKR